MLGELQPEIVTMRDSKNHIWVLLYSYYTTLTGRGPSKSNVRLGGCCVKVIDECSTAQLSTKHTLPSLEYTPEKM